MDINNKMITGQPSSFSDSRKEENQKEHYEDKFIIKLFCNKLSKNNGIISTK